MPHASKGMGGPRVVFAVYQPRQGQDAKVRALIAEHLPTLRRLQLATDRPAILLKSDSGAYVEIFEWQSDEAAERAHDHPEVARIWEAMGKIAEFKPLASLPETKTAFSHYEPVAL